MIQSKTWFNILLIIGVILLIIGCGGGCLYYYLHRSSSPSSSSIPINRLVTNCLCRGMKILTPSGYVPIESLKKGDLLVAPSFNNRTVEIQRILSSTYVGIKENLPYRIPAHFFGKNKPSEDILISPLHRVFHKRKWHLPCQIEGIRMEESMLGKTFEYYHIELPDYYSDKMWCNNMPVDSLEKKK